MTVQTQKMTASEFLTLPVSNLPHELIDGQEIMSPSPTGPHQRVLFRVAKLIEKLIPNGEVLIAPMDIYFDEVNVPQPDIFWIASDSRCTWVEDKYLSGAPDLIVEIFSPGTVRRDKKDKFRLYEKYGVREYWMIDPDEKFVEIWQLKDASFAFVNVFGATDPCESPLLGNVDMKAIFPD